MSKDDGEYQHGNLTFFKDSILDSDRATSVYLSAMIRESDFVLKSIGLMEATLWLRLGSEIGFFNGESVIQFLVSIEEELSGAWRALLEASALSSDTWCDFMSREPKPIFLKDKFLGPRPLGDGIFKSLHDAEHLEYLRNCFWGYLSLTCEVIFDETTMAFLESIGWASDATWKSRISGYSPPSEIGVRIMYAGFANHVQYLENLDWYTRHTAQVDLQHLGSSVDMQTLLQRVRQIVSQRIVFDRPHVRERCIRLGSEIMATVNQPGPEWQDVQRSIFSQIMQITGIHENDIPRAWANFVESTKEDIMRATKEPYFRSAENSTFSTE
jgi:hypothetical protein